MKRILTEQSNAVYVPPGYILFASDGLLLAQHFDAAVWNCRARRFR
jgi:hypothetical protein